MRRTASSKTSVISTSSWIAGNRRRNRGSRSFSALSRRSSSGLPSASSNPNFRRFSIRSPFTNMAVCSAGQGNDASCRAAGGEENCAVRFRSGPAFYRIRTRNRAPNDSVGVQRGGIKLACPDALTERIFAGQRFVVNEEGGPCSDARGVIHHQVAHLYRAQVARGFCL